MRQILGLHGLPHVGKDTAARHLTQQGWKRLAFADRLYEEVALCFGVTVEQLRDDDWKDKPREELAIMHCLDPEYRGVARVYGAYDLYAPRSSRFHLRYYGTEYRRTQNPRYWLDIVLGQIADCVDPIVITDLRFQSEWMGLRQQSAALRATYRTVELTSCWALPGEHASDERLPDAMIDHIIENVFDLPQIMLRNIDEFVELDVYKTRGLE